MNTKLQILFVLVAAIFVIFLLSGGAILGQGKGKGSVPVGQQFHNETSITWKGVVADMFSSKPKRPAPFKKYPDAKKIALPEPQHQGIRVEQAIAARRSIRNYTKEPIDLSQLSQLLFAASGITGRSFGQGLRSAPSAGALYPFEIYVIVNNVKELPNGIYHYFVLDNSLEMIREGDFGGTITSAGLQQEMLGDSAVTFVLSAIFDRCCSKYGQRGYRYVYIEAGHISQNIALEAVSLGLGSVTAGAFLDDKVNELIQVDGKSEAAIYLHAVGAI